MDRVAPKSWWLAAVLALVLGAGVAAADESSQASWLGIRLGGPFPVEEGVAVSRVFTDSPAERAGLRGRDVIVAFAGEPVTGPRDLVDKIRSHDPGSWLSLTVLRGEDELEMDVRLGERPEAIPRDGVRRGWIGLQAIELPASLREHFGAPPEAGVMISEVAQGSPAEAAGFRLGDVVHAVDDIPVESLRALHELIEGGGVGNEYEFDVARNGTALVLEAVIAVAPPRER
jgi:S1-C subfamily serine protease